jgi:hypothetical protein
MSEIPFPKEYMEKLLHEYNEIPNGENINKELYNSIIDVLEAKEPAYTNGEIVDTLKTIVLMMCKNCTDYCDDKEYERIQESMK